MGPIVITGPISGPLQTTYAHNLGYAPANVYVQAVQAGTAGAGAVTLVAPYWDATYVYLSWSDYGLTAQLTVTAFGSTKLL